MIVDAVVRGEDALSAAASTRYDAVLVDLGLPDLDGLDVIRRLRAGIAPDVPILVLTARHSVDDKVIGLDAGADDYLPKPFDLLELDARLRSITRRTGRSRGRAVSFGNLHVDWSSREVSVDDRPLTLTRRELALLEELMRAGGHTLVRDVLEDRLYGVGETMTGNALEAIVSRLRRRLAQAGAQVGVETIRGIGYRLVLPPSPDAHPDRDREGDRGG